MRNKSFFGHKTKIGYRDDFKNDLKKNNYYYGHVILNIELAQGKKNKQQKKDWKEISFLSENEKNTTKFSF